MLYRKHQVLVLLLINSLVVYYFLRLLHQMWHVNEGHYTLNFNEDFNSDERYLVDTPTCRMANINPFNKEVQKYFFEMKPIECSKKPLLTYISYRRDGTVTLSINKSVLPLYSWFEIECCYSTIHRDSLGEIPDNKILFSDCIIFNREVEIVDDFIRVDCETSFSTVYSNVHAVTHPLKVASLSKNDDEHPSVLLIAIDGVSRLNFIRTMPRTYQYFERNNWIPLKGYHKIEDNTFPNIMALLTGMNVTDAYRTCNPDRFKLDKCNFIWKHYKRLNYTTAFAEDSTSINAFNYLKKGFRMPPTNFYFRPYFLAAEQLPSDKFCIQSFCSGPESNGKRMLRIISDFSYLYRYLRSFGLFWMNSFSHDIINCPTTMDKEIVGFLEKHFEDGLFRNTIIVFFSDHGFRFGDIRTTHTGWMEERLPFIYFWLPWAFKQKYPLAYNNLKINSQRLTSTYDFYMTLQDILFLSKENYKPKISRGCPKCTSLFNEISTTRTCEDAGIEPHWCTCRGFYFLPRDSTLVRSGANFLLKAVNNIVSSYGKVSNYCSVYLLKAIINAESFTTNSSDPEQNILITIRTFPEALFEGTINVKNITSENFIFSLTSSISRIDRYYPKSYCVRESPVQKYCYCKSLFMFLTNIFCNYAFCLT